MVDLYTAICIQTNRRSLSHRKEIREANLNRALDLIDYSIKWVGMPVYAPTRLIVFPEVFMQGWLYDVGRYKTIFERVAGDLAIEIPGEETELLGKKAKQHNIYIAGTAHEVIPELYPNYSFNCGFIIDPRGEVVYKHHKYDPFLPYGTGADFSPHDVWDKYIEVMDGKYGRKKGDLVSCFFPVIETDIGKLGYIICNEGFYIENSKALGLQGCEVMVRSSGVLEPQGSPPQQSWEISNRAAALFNQMYVVGCSPGSHIAQGGAHGYPPINNFPGQSMIVDFNGALIQYVQYPGETVTGAVLNVEALRKRRTESFMNFTTQLRTEVYAEMYKKPIYPKNLWLDKLPEYPDQRREVQPIKRFLAERIFIPPSK